MPAPSVQILTISEDRDGQRLDNFLFNTLKGVPKTHVYRLLRTGQVRINGKRCKPDTRIAAGDLLGEGVYRTTMTIVEDQNFRHGVIIPETAANG